MGNRLARGSVLSDPKVIDLLNREFVVTELNVTEKGFPASLPALAWWKKVFLREPVREGFANQVVVDPSGHYPLASGDDGLVTRWSTSINYNPELFRAMLRLALDRWHRLQAIQDQADLSAEEKDKQIADLKQEIDDTISKNYRRPMK